MSGVPGFVEDLGWLAVFAFLTAVVFARAQGTYWLGRWARRGTESTAASARPRAAAMAARLSGPAAERARAFLDAWGFVGVPVSFLTIGFQTMVNATAGYTRMRWDLYTLAMVPGCLAWAAIYATLGLTLLDAFVASPWLGAGTVVAIVALVWGATRLRRSAGSAARTPR